MKTANNRLAVALALTAILVGNGCDTTSEIDADIDGVWREASNSSTERCYFNINRMNWTQYTFSEEKECYESKSFVLHAGAGDNYYYELPGKRAQIRFTLENDRLRVSGDENYDLIRARVRPEQLTPRCEWPVYD